MLSRFLPHFEAFLACFFRRENTSNALRVAEPRTLRRTVTGSPRVPPALGAARGVAWSAARVATPRRLTARMCELLPACPSSSSSSSSWTAMVSVKWPTRAQSALVEQAVESTTVASESLSLREWTRTRVHRSCWGRSWPELIRLAPEWHLEAAPEPLSPDDLGTQGRQLNRTLEECISRRQWTFYSEADCKLIDIVPRHI
jgi:hypothetical protein